MALDEKLPEDLRENLRKGLLQRLPFTFLPHFNQQLREWSELFPYEQRTVSRFLLFLAALSDDQSTALFRDVVQLEKKMDVRHWPQFSTDEETILNSSLLARSPYYQEWRRAVQAVLDAVEQRAPAPVAQTRRLVLLVIPRPLPLDSSKIWRRWQGIGRPVKLDLSSLADGTGTSAALLGSSAAGVSRGMLQIALRRPGAALADTWVCDAGSSLVERVTSGQSADAAPSAAMLLSYGRLSSFRENFAHEMNTMRKDLADADLVFDRLRKVDVARWCPAEVASQPALQKFLRSLYLSGNGALIFGNSFVEWAASEALRRARPSFLVAQFGIRSKPKPFTSVVLFENPDRLNPLPSVDDLTGSALDAEVLALYVWLAAIRYQEYRRSTVCVCVAESISEAYITAPDAFTLGREAGALSLDRLSLALRSWIA